MGNIIKSINLDLILEGTGVTPTIPSNPRAVFGDPDFDQTSDLMIGQKAYNVTDDIWYYRSKTGIKIIPTESIYYINANEYQSTPLVIFKPGNYIITASQGGEVNSPMDIIIHLPLPGCKATIILLNPYVNRIYTSAGQTIFGDSAQIFEFISLDKSMVKLNLPPGVPDVPDVITYYILGGLGGSSPQYPG